MFTQRSVLHPAAAIIFVHSHPSGDREPSHLETHICKLPDYAFKEHPAGPEAAGTQVNPHDRNLFAPQR